MCEENEKLLDLTDQDIPTFEIAALGCNTRAMMHLGDFLQAAGIETFHFYEYFFTRPIRRKDVQTQVGDNNAPKVCFPFIQRVMDKYFFIPYDSTRKEIIKDRRPKWKITLALKIKGVHACHERKLRKLCHNLLDSRWLTLCQSVEDDWRNGYPCFRRSRNKSSILKYTNSNIKKAIFQNARKLDVGADLGLIDDITTLPWYATRKSVISVALPIATPSVLYGYTWLTFAEPDQDAGRKSNWGVKLEGDIRKSIGKIWMDDEARTKVEWKKLLDGTATQTTEDLAKIIVGLGRFIYAPVLALTFNSIWEMRLRDEKERRTARYNAINSYYQIGETEKARCDTIESGLSSLWENRKQFKLCEQGRPFDPQKEREFIKQLLFAKYRLASPGMIEQMETVIKAARSLKKQPDDHDSLPTALVYGEAGSGKDTMARMLALFSTAYSASETITVNAGAIKPDEIAGPMLLGADIRLSKQNARAFDGIFIRAVEDGDNNSGAVFILDELNSLDPALQTILLRIIENGEVQPLFSIASKPVRHLVVGIVNEDPEEVSRESEMSQLQSAKAIFGSILGAFIYEGMRKTRRLRPDLMYRLKRGAYIRMPSLRDRREDIPIIFLDSCRKEYKAMTEVPKKPKNKSNSLRIELRAAEKLMDPRYSWPGNMRDLQAVAKRAVNKLIERGAGCRKTNVLEITLADVVGALNTHFGNLNSHGIPWKRTPVE